MKNKSFLIFTLFILFLLTVKASSEADWILSNLDESNIEETAYAVLALKTEPTTYRTEISTYLNTLKENLDSCVLKDNCDIKNAALSILALKGSISSTSLNDYATWLLNSASTKYTGETSGWLIQIVSSEPGECTLGDTKINVRADYTPWFSIPSSILTSAKSLELDCSDLPKAGLILSLIQEKTEDDITYYYIKQEEHDKSTITLDFGNPCWGYTPKASCNEDVTALVLYTLKQAGKQADTTWLEQQILTPLQNAYLYKTTLNEDYLDILEVAQNPAGDWNQDIFTTAMIVYLTKTSLSLDSVDKANSWIQLDKDPSNNCWPSLFCDVKTTSAVLMSKLVITTNDADGDEIDDTWEEDNCEGDCNPDEDLDDDELTNYEEYIYNTDPNNKDTDGDTCTDGNEVNNDTDPLDETDCPITNGDKEEECSEGEFCWTIENCPGECDFMGACIDIEGDDCPEIIAGEEECIYGDICTTDVGCPGECSIYGICEDIEGDGCPVSDIEPGEKPTTKETEKERGVLFWFLMVLLLLIILVGGGYLAYKKGLIKFKFGKKPPKAILPTYKPKLRPTARKKPEYKPVMRSRKSPVRKHMEKALEKSMKEMEDLLKGK